MFKRQHYIALISVVALTLIILNLPSQAAARLRVAIGSVFLPLFGLADSAHEVADRGTETVLPRSTLLKENERLRRENQELRIRMMELEEVARENNQLRESVAWQQRSRWRGKLARVVSRDPANWWRTVQINVGSRDGIRENLPVLTTSGLVGRVASVGLERSQVVLLGDPNCRVSALVDNDAGDMGVIGTGGTFDGSLVDLAHLSRTASLRPGQNVTTSGLGGIFPKGILIGQIVDSRHVDFGSSTEARVKLGANLSALDEVWVLFP